jgi:ATP-dependent Clp protease ATP-binding subunit ClpC
MSKANKYVGFIDRLENMSANKENEANNYLFLTDLFNTQTINIIFTISDTAYSKYIKSKPEFERLVTKIDISAPDDDFAFDIVKAKSYVFEEYNNIKYNDSAIREGIKLAKRFVTSENIPASALNIVDAAGAYVKVRECENEEISLLRKRLDEIEIDKNSIKNSSSAEEFDRKDALIREELDINKKINAIENTLAKSHKKTEVSSQDVKKCVSEILGIPLSEVDCDEKTKLKNLSENLRSVVIGQDEAISDITRAVKRQRIGLQNPDSPIVMLFVGNTGTGKTFLAKRLAYEMFGDEKKIVRLDMSEYGDKTSVNKIYGSSPGYVGYEEGGVLTEAIKKNGRCVLLLDEIEKAHEDVFNVLLQVFDEGRLTDNRGTLVDFKNVIIIMTSNVGAKDISEKVAHIGFGKHDTDGEDKEIIKNSIKKTFKPEFINRIDNICYFNKLTDDNLRHIIINEVRKVKKKLEDIGYGMDDDLCTGKLIDSIFENVKKEAEYGARPIIREIQVQLEDKITDYIIDNNVNPGFIFKYNDIYKDDK